jgi:hypothetical protein
MSRLQWLFVALLTALAVAFAIPATRESNLGRFLRGECAWPRVMNPGFMCRQPPAEQGWSGRIRY